MPGTFFHSPGSAIGITSAAAMAAALPLDVPSSMPSRLITWTVLPARTKAYAVAKPTIPLPTMVTLGASVSDTAGLRYSGGFRGHAAPRLQPAHARRRQG